MLVSSTNDSASFIAYHRTSFNRKDIQSQRECTPCYVQETIRTCVSIRFHLCFKMCELHSYRTAYIAFVSVLQRCYA